jgi:polyisoprenoid-binding protein YceI
MPESDVDTTRVVNHVLLPKAGAYAIDPVHTFVMFRAQHLVVGRVRGRFERVSGSVTIAEDLAASTLEVSVETESIRTLVGTRDDDLRSEHYLDAAVYPTMTYRSTGLVEVPGGAWQMDGELTLRGVTRPLELLVYFGGATIDPWGNVRLAFHATGALTRTDFGITFELLKEAGSLLVRRDVAIEIDAEVTRHP